MSKISKTFNQGDILNASDLNDMVTVVNANADLTIPTSETYTIGSSSWSDLASSSPFKYSAAVTATHTIGSDTVCEMVNDQAVAFANYGFSIGAVSGQSVTIYAVKQPDSSVNLTVDYYG